MTRWEVRVPLFVAFVAALAATSFVIVNADRDAAADRATFEAFRQSSSRALAHIAQLRTGLQAYVAVGQGGAFWRAKVGDGLHALKDDLATLRQQAREPEALNDIDAVGGAFEELVRLNDRAQRLVRADDLEEASPLVYREAEELLATAESRLRGAVRAESQPRAARETLRRRQEMYAAAGVVGLSVLVALALLPTGRRRKQEATRHTAPAIDTTAPDMIEPSGDMLSLGLRTTDAVSPANARTSGEAAGEALSPGITPTSAPDPGSARSHGQPAGRSRETTVSAPAGPARDRRKAAELNAMADLCTDFARVLEPQELPALLERAARLIDASGFVVWVGDPTGRELRAALAHGYSAHALARLPAIPRDADNATAAAWREAQIQVVQTNGMSPGALVAPLLTPVGCIGAFAAEVRHGREDSESIRALARILAAQLSTLVSVAPASSETAPRAEIQQAHA